MKPIISLFIFLLLMLPGWAQDPVLILVSPDFKLNSPNAQSLGKISDNLSKLLKEKFKDLGYSCVDYNFQDWDDFSDDDKIDVLKEEKARYAISTDKVFKIKSNNPAKSGYEINFIIEHLNDESEMEIIPWKHSKFIIKGVSDSYMGSVAKNVSADIDYYFESKPEKHFRPRFKISDFEMDPENQDFDFDDFAKDLKKLLKDHELYVFYYKEKYYPDECNNLLTGELVFEGSSNSEMINMVILVKYVPEDEEVESDRTFKVHVKDFIKTSETNDLVEEIEKSIKELEKNTDL